MKDRENLKAFCDYLLYPLARTSYRCPRCRVLLWLDSLYCRKCIEIFHEDRKGGASLRTHPLVKNFQVRGLWSWTPDLDDELSGLLVGLKGGKRPPLFRELARLFLSQNVKALIREGRIAGFIPMPSRDGQADHASVWAEALANELGLPVFYALERLSGPQSRHQSRGERLARKQDFRLREGAWDRLHGSKVADPENSKRWVVVDDILTTGATSRRALQTLGLSPSDSSLWILAFRERNSSDSLS